MFAVNVPIGRTHIWTSDPISLDGSPFVLAADDKLRFKVYKGAAGTPVLDLLSGDTAAGGSTVAIVSRGTTNQGLKFRVTFGQADIEAADVSSGPYDAELIAVDDSESSDPELRNRSISIGVVHFLYTGGGNLGPS
jgi:hypothetical protein